MGSRLALLICIALLSAAMANGIRPAGTVGAAAAAPSAAVTITTTTTPIAGEVTTTTPVAAGEIAAPSDKQQPPSDDPYKDTKRKVPNGPDPIHNRRARWGEAPARRV